tara:strand:+ start:2968 stop:6249 length:3282 start_codon:yes stop_codon:yes gene_type:complete
VQKLGNFIAKNENKLSIKGTAGSSFAFIVYSIFKNLDRSVFISFSNKEEAKYFLNDLESIDDKLNVWFFPIGERNPYSDNEFSTYNILQRTEVLNMLYSSRIKKNIIITFDNAISEKVLIAKELNDLSFKINIDDNISIDKINERLFELDFKREDFVSQPGDFSVRGGILDIFSFSNDLPYRIEFFGDQVNRIRTFNVETQLSESIHPHINITSNTTSNNAGRITTPIFNVLERDTIVFIKNIDLLCSNINADFEYSKECYAKKNDKNILLPQNLYSNTDEIMDSINKFNLIEFDIKQEKLKNHIKFDFIPQPSFNKSFKILIDNLNKNHNNGYTNYICCTNKQQETRLNAIFNDINSKVNYNTMILPISSGFIDNENKLACYTDHQIFERYHKFRVKKRYYNNRAINLRQINRLNKGDYVTHIDHGIGIFGGLQKIDVDGKIQEAIKLIYGERDILYLSIHSLYKISKYSGKDGKVPRIYKLGSKAWALLKEKTKSKVKKIAYDLIKVYAKRKRKKGYRYQRDSYLQTELEASFIYEDTQDQLKVTSEIKSDMETDQPMDRLVCGDVGFGKTEVAIRAAFKAVDNNKQVVVLVPTTILAFQHYKTFTSRLEEFPISIDYLNRFRSTKEKNDVIYNLYNGNIDIIIGTHQIINEKIKFKDIGLLIIDEEQKFGVSVKEKLKSLKENIDVLTLSATPIPRTLQFSLMAARDLSIITTPPPNRYPIDTKVIRYDNKIIVDAINYEIERGGQIFFVNNKINNISDVADLLRSLVPQAIIEVAHGQLKGKKLEELMIRFINGDFDILVSTTIIESGLDVPNANTIFINNANHFGLSDLHQMRGRVGRSNKKAFCYLITPEYSKMTDEARKRITALEYYSELGSGFNIAMKDLEIRGAGDLLGGNQSGFINEMGFETYNKILDEAIEELKNNEFKDLDFDHQKLYKRQLNFDTDFELLFPDDYINSNSERLKLYSELNKITKQDQLELFNRNLIDRFGQLPFQVVDLLKSIELKWLGIQLDFDKIILKRNTLICYFIGNNDNNVNFLKLIKFVNLNSKLSNISEKYTKDGNRMVIKFFKIDSISSAQKLLEKIIKTEH